MKNLSYFTAVLFLLITLSSCNNHFVNARYQDGNPLLDQSIAILPYEIFTTGRLPKEITAEQLDEIETAESRAFQTSLYHQLLRRFERRYHYTDIRFQHFDETNALLDEAGISVQDSWRKTTKELAAILGVDVVVKTKVHKTHYLTDLESFGVHVARNILVLLSNFDPWIFGMNKTSDVRLSCSVLEGDSGYPIWTTSQNCPTNWAHQTYDVIEQINYRISRKVLRKR